MSLVLFPKSAHDAATNMAIDAALLDSVPEKSAIFRHYSWTEPAITFGYTQRIQEVKTVVPETIRLCRRLTGGGIVDHRNDWTYALIFHPQLEAAQIPVTQLYADVHRCIQSALAHQSIATQLAPCPHACDQTQSTKPASGPSQCFVQPTANDVLHPSGIKIAGAAIKRTRQGLLLQGSIDLSALPDTFEDQSFSNAFQNELAERLTLKPAQKQIQLLNQQNLQLRYKQFNSDEWNQRR